MSCEYLPVQTNVNGYFIKRPMVLIIFLYDQFILLTLKNAAFDYLAACLSAISNLLPGLIPFASLMCAG